MVPAAADLLRARGIQVTAQRLAVFQPVAGRPHITADVVAEVVRAEIGTISLQTVYDTLGLLVAEGLIRRIQPAASTPCLTAVDDRGYEIDEAEVAEWGRCPECLTQARAPVDSRLRSAGDAGPPPARMVQRVRPRTAQ